LTFENKVKVHKNFIFNHKRERYSVNYYDNYKKDTLRKTLSKIDKKLSLPVYINSYLFRNCDIKGEHKTQYTQNNDINNKFNGETIDGYLIKINSIFANLF
jgi:hypothetical protein